MLVDLEGLFMVSVMMLLVFLFYWIVLFGMLLNFFDDCCDIYVVFDV